MATIANVVAPLRTLSVVCDKEERTLQMHRRIEEKRDDLSCEEMLLDVT